MNLPKIISAAQSREVDAYSIAKHYASSWDLMESAATAFTQEVCKSLPENADIAVVCGPGNNGGDGLAISRLLQRKGFKTKTYLLPFHSLSKDCALNLEKVSNVIEIDLNKELPDFTEFDFIIDAILGSGLSRPIEGRLITLVQNMNDSKAKVISVDIPTGLFSDRLNTDTAVVSSDYCITFERPKLSFFLPENNLHLKKWKVVKIGLDNAYLQKMNTNHYWLEQSIQKYVQGRRKFSHKGSYGHGLLLAGSSGKMGAAVLTAKACLRSGIGLLTARVPKCGVEIMQIAVPEAMLSIDPNLQCISKMDQDLRYSAIGIGPGLGLHNSTTEGILHLIQKSNAPMVVDADALNILSKNPEYLNSLPADCILTPHPKEFERLAGTFANSMERLEKQIQCSKTWRCYIVLKDAHTIISTPSGAVYFNSNGNPGMATGGSGDVLTGIILALLAQGYKALEAALTSVYFHGASGDKAASIRGEYGLIASDLIEHLRIEPKDD